jgi:hypothetical protein
MIVFDLKCANAHVFEAWFGSSGDFEDQRARNLVACPICGDGGIDKAVMAPNVGAKGNQQAQIAPAAMKAAMAALAQAQSKALEGSEWVGASFAGRARAMHVGEEDHAPIHGQATIAEAKALADDGIPVAPLPLPVVPPEACN